MMVRDFDRTERYTIDWLLILAIKLIVFFQVFNLKLAGVPADYYAILVVFIGYLLIVGLYYGKGWYFNKAMFCFLIFFLFLSASALWSDYAMFTLGSAVRYIVILCFLLLFVGLRKKSDLHSILGFYLHCVLALSLLSLFHFLNGSYDFYGRFLFSIHGERGDPNFAAFVLLFCAIASYYLKLDWKGYRIYFVFFLVLFFMTFSRGGLLCLLLVLLSLIPLYFLKYGMDTLILKLILGVAGGALVVSFSLIYAYVYHYEIMSEVFRFESLSQGAGRVELLMAVVDRMSTNWLYGMGYNTFILDNEVEFENGRIVIMATHNSYLEFLYGGGVIGLGIFLVFIFLLFCIILGRTFHSQSAKRLQVFVLASFLLAFFNMMFINLETHRLLWTIVGFSIVLGRKSNFVEAGK